MLLRRHGGAGAPAAAGQIHGAAVRCFLGYYPLIKLALERLRQPALRWGLKLAVCSVVVAVALFLLRELLLIAVPLESTWSVLLAFAAADAAFCVYDYALTQVILIYMRKIQGRLK